MKHICLSFLLAFSFLAFHVHANTVENEALVVLLEFAVENDDTELLKEVVTALVDAKRDGSFYIIEAISKYNSAGKLDLSLHNAILAKDLSSSVILAYYSNDFTKRLEKEVVWTQRNGTGKSGSNRDGKNPVELALWADMKSLISFLISRGADIYQMRGIGFVFDEEEQLDFIKEVYPDAIIAKKTCLTTGRPITATSHNFHRNLIGDAIARNQLDVIELLGKKTVDWNIPCFKFYKGTAYTPIQYALLLKRNDIAQYLITHGAAIR